jgi:hypothetical protein
MVLAAAGGVDHNELVKLAQQVNAMIRRTMLKNNIIYI